MEQNIDPQKQFSLAYQEAGQFIRHYSTLRATLVAFLITLGGAVFLKLKENPASTHLVWIGDTVFVLAFLVNLYFSYRNEKFGLYQQSIWIWFGKDDSALPPSLNFPKSQSLRVKRMLKDTLNWICLILVFAFILSIHKT